MKMANELDEPFIYAIRLFENFEFKNYNCYSWSCSEIVGWFATESEALTMIESNAMDICEACFDHAIVEKIGPGFYGHALKRWLFQFNNSTSKYEQIDLPEGLKIKGKYDTFTFMVG